MIDHVPLRGITIREATPDDAETIYRQRLAMFEDIWGDLDPDGVAAMESTFIPWVRRADHTRVDDASVER
jgi:hypothetical protein